MKIEIAVTSIVHIIVEGGPIQCEKAVLLEQITQKLREEFDAGWANSEVQQNSPSDMGAIKRWELKMERKANWLLNES